MSQATQLPVRTPSWKKTARDMLLTLAVIGAVVAVIYLLVPRPDQDYVPPVDVKVAVEQAVSADQAPVVEPATPQGWSVTSARLEPAGDGLPAVWQLGYLTDEDTYAALHVTAEPTADWITAATGNGYETGVQEVDGQPWRTFVGKDDGRTYLLSVTPGRATVVGGSAVLDDLVALAGATQQAPVAGN